MKKRELKKELEEQIHQNRQEKIYRSKLNESNDNYFEILSELLSNPSVPQLLLEKFSENEDEYIRAMVASNYNTPIQVLKKLSKDMEYIVTDTLFENPIYKSNKEQIGEVIPSVEFESVCSVKY
ncbi:hypothetical protein N9A28_02600 [Sulfurimonas sp.]|nr:hypothetical protein [Sulfurimonas sp.]